jgi:hypothetical protein
MKRRDVPEWVLAALLIVVTAATIAATVMSWRIG